MPSEGSIVVTLLGVVWLFAAALVSLVSGANGLIVWYFGCGITIAGLAAVLISKENHR